MTKRNEMPPEVQQLTCGLVMPISAIDGCSAEHWVEVKNIVSDAIKDIEEVSFVTKLVSEQDDVGVIQKRIVQNIYSSDVVVCDVSCKNANVMFELGMRLAFDKPTILIKDDATDFSFDTGVIEHLVYPRDLRFSRIVTFKKLLAEKVLATYRASQDDPNHSTFLKNFGSFKVATVSETVGTPDQLMIDMLQDLSREVARIGRRVTVRESSSAHGSIDSAMSDNPEELLYAINKYKAKNLTSSYDSLIGNDEFYEFLLGNMRVPSKVSSMEGFKKHVNEFIRSNPHIFS
jgi:hypothetical protein